MTTETSTEQISSRFARSKGPSAFRCPAPDAHGGRCLARLPCLTHLVEDPNVGMLLYGSSFFVPDGEPVDPGPPGPMEGWRPAGAIRDEVAYVDERLSRCLGVTVVVDPAMAPNSPGLVGIWNTAAWKTPPPPAYPHPEAARLAAIAPWLTFDSDGRTLDG